MARIAFRSWELTTAVVQFMRLIHRVGTWEWEVRETKPRAEGMTGPLGPHGGSGTQLVEDRLGGLDLPDSPGTGLHSASVAGLQGPGESFEEIRQFLQACEQGAAHPERPETLTLEAAGGPAHDGAVVRSPPPLGVGGH